VHFHHHHLFGILVVGELSRSRVSIFHIDTLKEEGRNSFPACLPAIDWVWESGLDWILDWILDYEDELLPSNSPLLTLREGADSQSGHTNPVQQSAGHSTRSTQVKGSSSSDVGGGIGPAGGVLGSPRRYWTILTSWKWSGIN
jgi:hypothetical protein